MIEEDDGLTLWSPEVPDEPIPHDLLARAYGCFATQQIDDPGWFTRGMLRHRVAATDAVSGMQSLRKNGGLSDSLLAKCALVWQSRHKILDLLDGLPQVLSHGDALPRNMLRAEGADVVAVDWGQLGYNTVGADLATLVLYSSTPFADLVDAYVDGVGGIRASGTETVRNATVRTAALMAISRAGRSVAAQRDVDGYLERLRRAEPLLDEVTGS